MTSDEQAWRTALKDARARVARGQTWTKRQVNQTRRIISSVLGKDSPQRVPNEPPYDARENYWEWRRPDEMTLYQDVTLVTLGYHPTRRQASVCLYMSHRIPLTMRREIAQILYALNEANIPCTVEGLGRPWDKEGIGPNEWYSEYTYGDRRKRWT